MSESKDRPAARPDVLGLAARLEDRAHAVLGSRLRKAGWAPAVAPQVGYGSADGWVRVLARVLLRPPSYDAATAHRSEDDAQRGFRRFLTQSAADVPVTITVGDVSIEVCSTREGYVDEMVEVDLEPGWATALLSVEGGAPVTADLRVVGPGTEVGLLSDIDDTVMVTMLPRPLVAFRNAFLTRENARRAVPGMAELYDEVLTAHPDAFVVYLSTGAWNAAPALRRFLVRHGYPRGPLLLTDWGPTTQGWFRSGQEHKRTQLSRLLHELPELCWLLVGDDGQHDPSLYSEIADRHPDRLLGVAIRQLSVEEQVRTHLTTGSPDEGTSAHPAVTWARGPDGAALAAEMRRLGLLDPR